MPKAKTIDRLEYTRSRTIRYPDDGKVIVIPPVQPMMVNAVYDEELGVVKDCRAGVEVCPMCGAEVIHESGCVRCVCGWSRC